MTESLDQFHARTRANGRSKPLPRWGSALLFLSVFFVLQMGYGACRGTWVEHLVIGDLTVAPTAAVINALTPDVGVKVLGNRLLAPGGGITVLKGCEGTEVMFMLVAAFAAVVMPWRRRLIGLGLGILMVFCLNQLRLVGLFYAYRSDPSLFDLLHGTLAPIALVIAVAVYALFWFQRPVDSVNAPTGS
jgi:exosortase/archaeosortase family protein